MTDSKMKEFITKEIDENRKYSEALLTIQTVFNQKALEISKYDEDTGQYIEPDDLYDRCFYKAMDYLVDALDEEIESVEHKINRLERKLI